MKNLHTILYSIISALLLLSCSPTETTIEIIYTTDTHGDILPFGFITEKPTDHSMAHVATYLEHVRDTSDNVVLLDAGDFLQGTPAVYYYNFVDTTTTHVVASIFNYLKYDAITVGNHDIETGHDVYDRVVSQINAPVLAANAIHKGSDEPYFKPYTIIKKGGKKIAVIGLITPHIPFWLPEKYWEGMEFEDMVEAAQKWVDFVKKEENPDLMIGLFHAGYDYTYGEANADTPKNENASMLVANRVDGLDCILIGHDHKYHVAEITNHKGNKCHLVDAGSSANMVGHVTVRFNKENKKSIKSRLVEVDSYEPSKRYLEIFANQKKTIRDYSTTIVGTLKEDIYSNEALFGSSKLLNIVHRTMLKHTGAEISFTAPLSLNAIIPKGDLSIGEMFNIYKYENTLNSILLSGDEIRKYLEYSYKGWICNPDECGHLIIINNYNRVKNGYFNFDTAMGIDYTVNPFKPYGERVTITQMSDGTPFYPEKMYTVAINSYRFNGGGGHLTQGLGLSKEEIGNRLVKSIMRDLRGLTLEDLQETEEIKIPTYNNWKFVPEDRVEPFIKKDSSILDNAK
ncbi:MAG: bifunctional UDP-sugar hydrolase/5'-nucleotidase [Bacteroidia bacterium]|nr:bifunctional UDP-sugar hydrolase/5'-nucleotidase [Bacteroidia bacterium]